MPCRSSLPTKVFYFYPFLPHSTHRQVEAWERTQGQHLLRLTPPLAEPTPCTVLQRAVPLPHALAEMYDLEKAYFLRTSCQSCCCTLTAVMPSLTCRCCVVNTALPSRLRGSYDTLRGSDTP